MKQRKNRLALGVFSPSVLLRVARRLGLLDEAGLAVTEVPVPSSPAQFRALSDGALDAALTSPDNVLAHRFPPAGPPHIRLDARIVAAVDGGLGLGLYARPGLSDAHRLRGAAIAVDAPDSGFACALYALLESLGLRPGDYRVVPLGSTPRRLTALLAGECDATLLNAGNELLAEAAGAPRLAGLTALHRPYLGTVLCAVGDHATQSAMALAPALTRAAEVIAAGHADTTAAQEASRALDLAPALASRYVERLKDPDDGLITDGAVDPGALRTVISLRRRYLTDHGLPAALSAALSAALAPEHGLPAVPGPRRE